MKRNTIVALLIVLALVGVCFAAGRYSPPAQNEYHNLIAGLNDDFFTNFNPDQSIANKNDTPAAPKAANVTSSLLPVWDFRGPEILRARKTENRQEKGIYDKYALRFDALEKLANERLNILAAKALEEYNLIKPKGKLEKLELANKYLTAMSCLQENLDRSFYSELDNMQSELEAAGFSTDIIREMKSEYKNSKKEFENALMQKFEQKGY